MHVGVREPRSADVDHGLLRSENHVIHGTLRSGEAAVHRERTCDVRRQIADLCGSVDEEEVAVFHQPVVLRVVEDAGVVPRGDDRWIPLPHRAGRPEHVLHRRLHFVFGATGGGETDSFDMSRRRHPTGLLQGRDLVGRLDEPEFVQNGGWVGDHRRNGDAGSIAPSPRLPHRSEHTGIDRRADGIPQRVSPPQAVTKHLVEIREWERSIGAEARDGTLNACSSSVPRFHLRITRAHEEHIRLLVGGIEQRDGIRFVETGEEEEVGRLSEHVVDIVVAHGFG